METKEITLEQLAADNQNAATGSSKAARCVETIDEEFKTLHKTAIANLLTAQQRNVGRGGCKTAARNSGIERVSRHRNQHVQTPANYLLLNC
jgi:hypothetical protein